MTFLDPGGEPRTKSDAAETTPMAPWTKRRLSLVCIPAVPMGALASAIWLYARLQLIPWFAVAGLAGLSLLTVGWTIRAVRRGEWTAINTWQACGEAMPQAGKFRYGKRLDSFFVGQHGGIVVTISPPPPVSQSELDQIGHRAATARMLRAEPVEIVKNPHRLRHGYSARFGFVPK